MKTPKNNKATDKECCEENSRPAGVLKVSDFYCSEHGYINPEPHCPKCHQTPTPSLSEGDGWKQMVIDVGAEIDTHRDGDAFIRYYTFNEAQLIAFLSQTRAEERERMVAIGDKKK